MAYWQWQCGEPAEPSRVVLCVHGLTRQGRDFDVLARALLEEARSRGLGLRVVCPDVAGRGHSDRLHDPSLYQPLTYLADLQALLRTLQAQAPVTALDWVGTSMGGLIGMLAAAQPESLAAPLRRLVLNDVGPRLAWVGLERIRGYVGQIGPFEHLQAGLEALRRTLPGFGPHSDPAWRALNLPMFRPAAGQADVHHGPVQLHYDPALAQPFAALTPEAHARSTAVMLGVYERIGCPTLLLRGAQSELLSEAAALEMTRSGPCAQLVQFEGVGHAPTLVAADQVEAVRLFLADD